MPDRILYIDRQNDPIFATLQVPRGEVVQILSCVFTLSLLPGGEVVKPPLGIVDYTSPVPVDGFDTDPAESVRAFYAPPTTLLPSGEYQYQFLFTILDPDGNKRSEKIEGIVKIMTSNSVSKPPRAPSSVVASALSSTSIKITWNNGPIAVTTNTIYRSNDGITFLPIFTQSGTIKQFKDTGLSPSTLYWYIIQSTNSVGSASSVSISCQTLATTPTNYSLILSTGLAALSDITQQQNALAINHLSTLFADVPNVASMTYRVNSPSGHTYYASPSGSDSNAGTLASPFATIRKGWSVLTPGDTLLLRSGTYDELLNTSSQLLPSGTASKPVTIAAYPGESPILAPSISSGLSDAALLIQGSGVGYIVINGLVIDGIDGVTYNAVKITSGPGDLAHAASHITLTNCEIRNAFEQGILLADFTHDNLISGCNIHDNGTHPSVFLTTGLTPSERHGVYCAADHNTITGCDLHHNSGHGIQCFDSSGTRSHDNLVTICKCHDNAQGTTPPYHSGSGTGIVLASGSNNVAYNNLCWNNAVGIAISNSAVNCAAYFNTIFNSYTYGLDIESPSTGAILKDNIVWKSGVGWGDVHDGGSGSVKDHNLTGIDPLFVSTSLPNFHLQNASPAKSDGVSVSGITGDFDGITRSNPPSIGAYE